MSADKFEIEEVVLRVIRMNLREPFTTSGWTTEYKTPIIVELRGGGISGWGEAAVLMRPFYNHETPQTALHILKDYLVPLFKKEKPKSPADAALVLSRVQRNNFAKAGLEMAYWDWFAKKRDVPLYVALGGQRNRIPVGVSIGIQKDLAELVEKVAEYRRQGYQRIKIKVGPGKDLVPVQTLLTAFPDLPLMVDANSAYSFSQAAIFKAMDSVSLLMIEQPLHENDIYQHSLLQAELRNPICLDESIENLYSAQAAVALKSCRIVNIKPGRVGGLSESLKIHDFCSEQGIPVWCGGMLESGIGRATNMALATLPNFKFPGDISESKRYYHEDIVEPEIVLRGGGELELSSRPGIGFEVVPDRLKRLTQYEETFKM